ncbi:hypothetical protein ACH4M0_11170 [Streptomyces albidoflavus]
MRKITFVASTVASAATAFGLAAVAFSGAETPAAAQPGPTPTVTVSASPAPTATVTAVATERQTAPQATATQLVTAKPSAGARGPLKDAQDDGKVLDDVANWVVPGLPAVPDKYLPFPDDTDQVTDVPKLGINGENDPSEDVTEYPYDPIFGDDEEHASDPGVVCDAELAERLGVPLSPSC